MTGTDDRGRIFVALAAYREPELCLTIRDCLEKARHPERLRFGICLQYDDEAGEAEVRSDCIDALLLDDRFRASKHDHRDAKGGCWARHLTQQFYDGEEYTLQVDAHSRMIPDWDARLLEMIRTLPSEKPLITGFPPPYLRENGRDIFLEHDGPIPVPTTVATAWTSEGWLALPSLIVDENIHFPRRTRVLSGAFVFTVGLWNEEVRQDPLHLYTGEEFALTLRSFSWGYDLFNPNEVVVFHRSHPAPNPKYVTDFPEDVVHARHGIALGRLRTLIAGDPEGELHPYSLGPHRDLHEYYLFSGLDCANRTIHPDARDGVPPDPLTINPG